MPRNRPCPKCGSIRSDCQHRAPAASQAPGFEARVDALIEELRDFDELVKNEPLRPQVEVRRAALLAHHSAVESALAAAVKERDEARAAIDYAMSERHAMEAERDAARAEVARLSGALRTTLGTMRRLAEALRSLLDRINEYGWKPTSVAAASSWRKALLDSARAALSPSREGDHG